MLRIIVALLVFCGAAHAAAEKRVALVIGNNAYANAPALPNPKQDASDIADALGRLGFTVTKKLDATGVDMRRALVAFGRDAQGADMAAVFFAGHGMEIGGDNWLIPVDAEMRSDTDAESEAVSLRSAMTQVAKAKNLGMVILDACRNNPFANTMQRTFATRAVERGLARVEPPSDNILIAYAARDGTTAADGAGKNSPFTTALLKNLETPGLDVRFLFSNVRDDVMNATKRAQQPFWYASLPGGQIFLKEAVLVAAKPVEAPAATDNAFLDMIASVSDRAMLERLITNPTPAVQEAARKRMASLLAEPLVRAPVDALAVAAPVSQPSLSTPKNVATTATAKIEGLVQTIESSNPVRSIAVSARGLIASVSADDRIDLWDAGSGKLVRALKKPGGVGALAFSPDGRAWRLATGISPLLYGTWAAAS